MHCGLQQFSRYGEARQVIY